MKAQIADSNDIRNFIFGGRAKFTIEGKQTHFTYNVIKGRTQYLVYRVNGDYEEYLGCMTPSGARLSPGPGGNLPAWRAFVWYMGHIGHPDATFYHLGQCCVCKRPLTNPESIRSGIGPICKAS